MHTFSKATDTKAADIKRDSSVQGALQLVTVCWSELTVSLGFTDFNDYVSVDYDSSAVV